MSNFNVNTEMPLTEASALFDNIHQRVGVALAGKGLVGNTQPPMVSQNGQNVPYNGYIPADLTSLDDNGLGWYLGMLSVWQDYVSEQLAEAIAQKTIAENKLNMVEAHLLMVHKKDGEKKRPEPERKAMVLTDRRYIEAQATAIYHETFYRYVNAIYKNADQNYTAISRRISQRQQDVERQKRTSGFGNVSGPMFRTG